jgi:hypothetical protein
MKRMTLLGATVLLVGLVACGGGTSTPTRPTSTGKLTIVSPTANEVIHGTVLHVRLQLAGARLVQQASTQISPDTGHIHVSIDGIVKSLLAGLTYDATDLTPGRHLLTVEFVAADHGPFNPRVILRQTFQVEK